MSLICRTVKRRRSANLQPYFSRRAANSSRRRSRISCVETKGRLAALLPRLSGLPGQAGLGKNDLHQLVDFSALGQQQRQQFLIANVQRQLQEQEGTGRLLDPLLSLGGEKTELAGLVLLVQVQPLFRVGVLVENILHVLEPLLGLLEVPHFHLFENGERERLEGVFFALVFKAERSTLR